MPSKQALRIQRVRYVERPVENPTPLESSIMELHGPVRALYRQSRSLWLLTTPTRPWLANTRAKPMSEAMLAGLLETLHARKVSPA